MRILIFTDVNTAVSARLIRTTLRLASERGDIEVCGVVTSRPWRFRRDRARDLRRFLRRAIVAAANRDVPLRTVWPPTIDLVRLEREQGIPMLVPPDADPNDARFIEQVIRELRPQVALSYDCLTVLRKPLLARFEQAVNYHAGLLPDYRGVMATSFSIFAGEAESGFTFQRMTTRIDAGPILVQGSVPVANASCEDVARRKLDLAVASLPVVLDKIVRNDPGSPPAEGGPPFHSRDWQALIRVEHPEYMTAAQLRQRVRAFGIVNLTIGGVEYPVTRLRNAAPGQAMTFRTVDGVRLAPDRFDGLPRALYRLGAQWLRD